MNTVLVVAADDTRRGRFQEALSKYSVFTAASDAEALKLARLVDLDVVIRDGGAAGQGLDTFVTAVKEVAPGAITVAVGPSEEVSAADFALRAEFTRSDLEAVLVRTEEKHQLVRELATLRARLTANSTTPPVDRETTWDGAVLARVLKEFTRAFATGFDLPRMLEMFLDAVGELVRPTRMALLLPDRNDGIFKICAHRGLARPIVESVQLWPTAGLADWLAREGRPARRHDLADPAVARELGVLQAVVAVPLLAHAELVGILVLSQPVVGGGYGSHEIETLFDLATHLATTILDVTLHHQLAQQKELSERILAHMSSGVITIGPDERISLINRRAEQILGLTAGEVLHQDLRSLPSPLGDMLYETLATGRTTARTEIKLALGGLWLEVSTYPVRGAEPTPLGAVLVLEDLTAQKELASQKRDAEQFQLLTRVVARIADEIKNPLVSINTFVELIDERFDDPDFRKHFSLVVRRDVRRLVEVFEKLAGLVSEGELHLSIVDVHAVVDDLVTTMQTSDDRHGRPIDFDTAGDQAPQMVRTDVGQLRKALSYLVLYLADTSSADRAQLTISVDRHTERDGGQTVRMLVSSKTAQVLPEKLGGLFDPVQMVQEGLIQAGPTVSQRIVEALGGNLRLRQGRHELGFLVSLPAES